MPNDKSKKLYQYLKSSNSSAVDGLTEDEFVSIASASDKAAKLYDYLNESEKDAIGDLSKDEFISILSTEPTQTVQQSQQQSTQFTQQPQNLQKVGDKQFDSNSAKFLMKDLEGNDILEATTTDGAVHGVVRNAQTGEYDFYQGDFDRDRVAANLKNAIDYTKNQEQPIITDETAVKEAISNIPKFESGLNTEDKAKEKVNKQIQADLAKQEADIYNIKKAATALTRQKPADEAAFENQSELEKYGLGIKTGSESNVSDEAQSSLAEYKFRLESIDKENNSLNKVSSELGKSLQQKYGEKYNDYLDFLSESLPNRLKEAEEARQKGDNEAYNNIVEEINLIKNSFSDIENDDAFKFLGEISTKGEENFNRKKKLLRKDNFAIARALLSDERANRRIINEEGVQRKKKQDELWNKNDGYLSSIWGKMESLGDKTIEAATAAPEILATSTLSLPVGLINGATVALDALNFTDGSKVNTLNAANKWVNRFVDNVDDKSYLSETFKNTNIYSVMKGLSDLLPQMALAEITGGAMSALGASEAAIGKTAYEITRQSIANVGFMANDMYEANLDVLKDIDGLSDRERQTAAARLAFMQSSAVGAAGSLLGGALGSALDKSGIIDGALGQWIKSGKINQSEIRALFKKNASLIKDGAFSDYVKATGKGINEILKKNWGKTLGEQVQNLAQSGVVSITKNGLEEVAEEFALEPMLQYATEQVYGAFGGEVDLQELYRRQDEQEKLARKKSGRSQADDYLSVFAVGAIAEGAGDVIRGKASRDNAMLNSATLAALNDLPNFQKELGKYKESQLKGLEVNSPEYQQKRAALDQVESEVNQYINDVRNAGVKTKDGQMSTWDAMSKQVDEDKHEDLVRLLGERADLNREMEALKPIQTQVSRSNTREVEAQPPQSTAIARKEAQLLANEQQINDLLSPKKNVFSQAYNNLFGIKEGINDKIERKINETKRNAEQGTLTADQIEDTDTYQNKNDEERNNLVAKLETNEGQKEVANEIVKELEGKKTDNLRISAQNIDLGQEDISYNTSVRTPDSKDNIVYRNNRQYANANQEQVDKLIGGEKAGLSYTKGKRSEKDSDYVVERVKDNNGNFQSRVFKKTDNGYEVIYDEIGDKATLTQSDQRNIERNRYNSAMANAEAIRDMEVNKMREKSGEVDFDRLERSLKQNEDYQKAITEAKRLQPKDSIFGRVVSYINETKGKISSKQKQSRTQIERSIVKKIDDLKKKGEAKEVEC